MADTDRTGRARARAITVGLAVAMVAIAGDAEAQPTAAAPPAGERSADDPEALYLAGNAAYDAGKFQDAYELYRRAFAQRKSYEIAGNLGQTAAKLGKPAEAAEQLRYSLSIFPTNGNAERKARQEQLLAEVTKEVATLTVETNVADARVAIDGEVVGKTPLGQPLFVTAGRHSVRAEREGYAPQESVIDARRGSAEKLSLTLVQEQSGGTSRPLWPGIVLGIVAAGGLGAGIGLVVVSSNKHGEAEEATNACPALDQACIDTAQPFLDDANALLGGSIAGFAIGGAALTGALIYLLAPEPSPDQALFVVPQAGPSMIGLTIGSSF